MGEKDRKFGPRGRGKGRLGWPRPRSGWLAGLWGDAKRIESLMGF